MISIIIPTYNEEEGIAKTICMIPKEIRATAELIVVDVSADMTAQIAQELGATVLRPKKKGKGYQMRYAVEQSKGDIIIFMDGDGTDPGHFIPRLVKKLDDAQLVLGCRTGEMPKDDHQMLYKLFHMYSVIANPISRTLHIDISDPLAGFRAIRRKDWDALELEANDFEIEIEMNIKAIQKGFTIAEVKTPRARRSGGIHTSKFLRSPKMWGRIAKMIMDFAKHERLEARSK